ncbi:MAG: hypothetical protein KDJ24_13240 [Gammaproteobacteria bacterium]|nr:hypothetical protein [Gammaproteobacteria bacterium]
MARNDRDGEVPSTRTNEWRDVQAALQLARQMAQGTAQALRSLQFPAMRSHVLRPADPRLAAQPSQRQARVRALLVTHFRLRGFDPFDVLNLTDGYRRLHRRLMRLDRGSFRMVTSQVANSVAAGGGGDTFGYVMPDDDHIYLNETYFSLGGGAATDPSSRGTGAVRSRTGRSEVVAGGGDVHVQQSLPVRAGVILHEATHLVFGADGAVHRAINAGTSITVSGDDCTHGYPQIMTLTQAIGDAYVWEKFAHCVHAATTR